MCRADWIRSTGAIDGTEGSWRWAGAESYDQGKGEDQRIRMVRPKNAISTVARDEASGSNGNNGS
jgi:hypothetical protein